MKGTLEIQKPHWAFASKVRNWRAVGPSGRVEISMERSPEKHVSLVEGGLALMQNVRVFKS